MVVQKKTRPRHLGRGLESLLSPIISTSKTEGSQPSPAVPLRKYPPDKELQESMRRIDIVRIRPNPYQARSVWNDRELAELAESIKTNGIIQPIIVRPIDDGFELIAGERRFRATKLAGLPTIPAMVRHATDKEMFELSLVENIHRTDLNPIEKAKAYQNYLEAFSLTQAEAGKHLGQDRSVIANYLRLLELPGQIQQMLIDGQLTMGHARAILAVPTDELRNKLANRAMAGRLSVREVERLVRRYKNLTNVDSKHVKPREAHIVDLEHRLASQLGTKVRIETRRAGHRGRIVIEFYSLDEFDRLTEKLGLHSDQEL